MIGRIGTDEAGKGDYFGPLVVAAVFLDDRREAILAELGLRESKVVSDARCRELSRQVREVCSHTIVRINPERYNALREKMGNLNHLLAWAHARAIEDVLGEVACDRVVTDRFQAGDLLRRALMERGRRVTVEERTGAESDLAVAAASVVARAAFLATLARLSKEVGVTLPKGATHVVGAARQVVARGGRELLRRVAKLHFKTTARVLSTPPSDG